MRIHTRTVVVWTTLLLLLMMGASACSFTTANISSLKLSKEKGGTTEASTFAPDETIYARATVSNVPSKVTLKIQFITEDVEGQPKNAPVPSFDKSFDLPSDGYVDYYVSPPPQGWPEGKYRIATTMHIESGEQKDQESATFTVAR
jgi:hypothetical protein